MLPGIAAFAGCCIRGKLCPPELAGGLEGNQSTWQAQGSPERMAMAFFTDIRPI